MTKRVKLAFFLILLPSVVSANEFGFDPRHLTPCALLTFHQCVQALDLPASRDQIERFLEPAVRREIEQAKSYERYVVRRSICAYPYWWNSRQVRRHPWWICP